ncbi:exosporium glycoprotein BclB-related protein [Lysinibacillus xylanilyticus]|uniref:exosporium glycoprotein BclB-related protein n=1 Tax=Lysinibacillus xylanilyticus TaxID=582475 RepID=UPI003D06F931
MRNDNSMNCGCSSDNNKCKIGPFEAFDATCSPVPSVTSGISIIPFSSGPFSSFLSTTSEGLPSNISLIGFGSAVNGLALLPNGDIDLTTNVTEAFSTPQAGNITAISASYSTTTTFQPPLESTIRAQIYRAAADSNIFSPTNAFVDLTPISTLFSVARGLKNVSPPVSVEAGDLLLMVFTATSSGTVSIIGNAMAGITIAL